MRIYKLVCIVTIALAVLMPSSKATPATPGTQPSAPTDSYPVMCLAIDQDARERTNNPQEPGLPIGLVVLGKATTTTKPEGGDRVFDVQVEKVLYGSIPGKAVRFSYPWAVEADKSLIFAMVPAVYEDSYELKYSIEGTEVKSQTALSAARLDFHVLSSSYIFVGKELSAGNDYLHDVEVVQSLYGPELEKGRKVTIKIGTYVRGSGDRPKVRGQEMIYFVAGTTSGQRLYDDWLRPEKEKEAIIYVVTTRLPADQTPAVVSALGRRNEYPVVEMGQGSDKAKVQEILFRGSSAEAVEMMGSDSDAAVTLAARTLMYRRKEARQDVLEDLSRELLVIKANDLAVYRRVKNLISWLNVVDEGKPDGEVGRLVDKYLEFLAGGPAEPAAPVREDPPPRTLEEGMADTTHALAWLLTSMDEKDVANTYSKRLLELRDKAKGRWKDEIQLALDAARVEDNLELLPALERSKGIKPSTIGPGVPAIGEALAFSHDSQLLAVDGTVWRLADWTKVWSVDLNGGSLAGMYFSNEDKTLCILGAGRPANYQVDLASGKTAEVLTQLKQGISSVSLSSDGKRIATVDYRIDTVQVWDLPEGRLLKSVELPKHCIHRILSPDGKSLVYQTGEHELTVEPLDTGVRRKLTIDTSRLGELAFTPDGKYLIVTTCEWSDSWNLLLFDATAEYKLVNQGSIPGKSCSAVAIANDSKHAVVIDSDGKVSLIALPDLAAPRLLCDKVEYGRKWTTIAFSPDGKLMALGSRYEPVRLFDAHTFQALLPKAGHNGLIRWAHFSADGKTLRTVGDDNAICLWDAETLRFLKRSPLPDGIVPVSIRPPDGRYILCAPVKDWDNRSPPASAPASQVKVVNADDGRTVCAVDLPMDWLWAARKTLWLDDTQAMCVAKGVRRRFDYLTGRIIDATPVDSDIEKALYNGSGGYATEDGKTLYCIGGDGPNDAMVETMDLNTGKWTNIGKPDMPRPGSCYGGLVPGGKYIYVRGLDLCILDHQTLKLVCRRNFDRFELFDLTFSDDGKRYALATGTRIFIDDDFHYHDAKTQTIIRVHDTLTGKIISAMPAPSRWVQHLQFAPDSKRLAAVSDDGWVNIWNLKE